MRMIRPIRSLFRIVTLLTITGLTVPVDVLIAQDEPSDVAHWDVTKARGKTREIDFDTSEGTWMSVDLSPDGRWIVFDLLGQIYRVSASGGGAECLTQDSGVALNYHPRYSPDGKEIAFVSDRAGQNNLWVMHADGSHPTPILLDPETQVVEPTWTPDGRYIVATRRFKTSQAFYIMKDRIWMFPREGGEGIEAVRLGSSLTQWPSVSPDGRYIYYDFANEHGQFRNIQRLDLKTGIIRNVTPIKGPHDVAGYDEPLGEVAPEVSPNGNYLAFARKIPGAMLSYRGHEYGPRTALWLRDLRTGEERSVMDPITCDAMYSLYTNKLRVLPGYSWSRDGRSIVISQGGKIRRLWLDTKKVETIPFVAHVHRTISEQSRSRLTLKDDILEVRSVRWPASSPDGRRLVFEAVGRLWIMDLPNGKPRPLTNSPGEEFELTPSWSPDGEWIAYTTWDDSSRGHVWRIRANGGRPEEFPVEAGIYMFPLWLDSRSVVVNRWDETLTRRMKGPEPQESGWTLLKIPKSGQPSQVLRGAGPLVRGGMIPAGRIFYAEEVAYSLLDGAFDGREKVHLWSVGDDGGDVREQLQIDGTPRYLTVSPDGVWVAFQQYGNVYIAPIPGITSSGVVQIKNLDTSSIKKLSVAGGSFPHWRNATTLEFVSANRYFAYHLDSGREDEVRIALSVPKDTPTGVIALQGAKIVTLGSKRVREKGTVVVSGARIICVGDCDVSKATKIVKVEGKTIIPGWIDVHTHYQGEEQDGLISPHRWASSVYLASGVTTTLDPGIDWPESAFAAAEMIDAGKIVGARAFSVGAWIFGWGDLTQKINEYSDAEHLVNDLADRGATSLKSYHLPLRAQRQMLIQAASVRGITTTAEVHDLPYLLGLVMDGSTGWEHWLQYFPIYKDVAQFFGQAKAHYSTQVWFAGYPQRSDDYWLGQTDLWADQTFRSFMPWDYLATLRDFNKRPLREYPIEIMVEGAKDIMRDGGYLPMGAHSQAHGLDSHWEVWSRAFDMDPMEALETATLHSAHFLGLERDLGSIEMGKLADLVVLNSDPLANIRNTRDIKYVMKGGHLYEAESLDELWPRQRPYGPKSWANQDIFVSDTRTDQYWDSTERATRSSDATNSARK